MPSRRYRDWGASSEEEVGFDDSPLAQPPRAVSSTTSTHTQASASKGGNALTSEQADQRHRVPNPKPAAKKAKSSSASSSSASGTPFGINHVKFGTMEVSCEKVQRPPLLGKESVDDPIEP